MQVFSFSCSHFPVTIEQRDDHFTPIIQFTLSFIVPSVFMVLNAIIPFIPIENNWTDGRFLLTLTYRLFDSSKMTVWPQKMHCSWSSIFVVCKNEITSRFKNSFFRETSRLSCYFPALFNTQWPVMTTSSFIQYIVIYQIGWTSWVSATGFESIEIVGAKNENFSPDGRWYSRSIEPVFTDKTTSWFMQHDLSLPRAPRSWNQKTHGGESSVNSILEQNSWAGGCYKYSFRHLGSAAKPHNSTFQGTGLIYALQFHS